MTLMKMETTWWGRRATLWAHPTAFPKESYGWVLFSHHLTTTTFEVKQPGRSLTANGDSKPEYFRGLGVTKPLRFPLLDNVVLFTCDASPFILDVFNSLADEEVPTRQQRPAVWGPADHGAVPPLRPGCHDSRARPVHLSVPGIHFTRQLQSSLRHSCGCHRET